MSLAASQLNPQGDRRARTDARRATPDRTTALAVTVGVAMALTIAGTVAVGPVVSYLSIVPLVVGMFVLAGRDAVAATALLFAYIAMEGMYKYVSDFSPAVYILRPLLLGAIPIIWLLAARLGGGRLTAAPLSGLLALFIGWGLVEVLNPTGLGLASGLATLFLFYLGPALFYPLAAGAAKSGRQVEASCWVMIAACTLVSAFAVVQFSMGHAWTLAHVPGYAHVQSTDWFVLDDHGAVATASFRPASTTSMGGGSSYFSMIGMVTAVGLMFSASISGRRKLALVVCLLLNVLGLLIDGVRLWVFCGVFGLLVLVVITAHTPRLLVRNLGLMLAAAAVLGVAWGGAQALSNGAIASRYADTAANPLAKFKHDRGGNVGSLLTLTAAYPLGVGYQYALGKQDSGAAGASNPALKLRNGETQFGAISGDMGVPGLVLLYGLFVGVLVVGWRAFRRLRRPHLRMLAATLLALLATYLPASFGGPCLQGAMHFWFVAGLLAALPGIERREMAAAVEAEGRA